MIIKIVVEEDDRLLEVTLHSYHDELVVNHQYDHAVELLCKSSVPGEISIFDTQTQTERKRSVIE